MNVREKLVEMSRQLRYCAVDSDCANCKRWDMVCEQQCVDDLLLKAAELLESAANGVTVQEWIPASEPPTLKDADKYGRVLAMEMGMMALVNYKGIINYPDRFPYWMPMPEPPKE